MSTARTVRENIARGKSYLRREEMIRALETTAQALREVPYVRLIGSERFEVEVGLSELLNDIIRVPKVHDLLPLGPNGQPIPVRYLKGKEDLLSKLLERLAESFRREEEEGLTARQRQQEEHRNKLVEQGQEALSAGDPARARVFWKRCLDAHGKEEPGLFLDLANRFSKAERLPEAVEIYEMGMEVLPKEAACYSGCIDACMALREYEKVEQLYERVIRQFGMHPKTLLKAAQFYYTWRRKDKAYDMALRALGMDASLTEAQDLIDLIDGKRR